MRGGEGQGPPLAPKVLCSLKSLSPLRLHQGRGEEGGGREGGWLGRSLLEGFWTARPAARAATLMITLGTLQCKKDGS